MQTVHQTETDVFCHIYTHAFSIHQFSTVVQRQSQYSPFSFRTHRKRRISLVSAKSILLVFYILLIFCPFSTFGSSCVLLLQIRFQSEKIDTISFRKWFRLSSIKVILIVSLHYGGHMYLLQVSSRTLPVSFNLLLCVFTFELQSESRSSKVCVSGNL